VNRALSAIALSEIHMLVPNLGNSIMYRGFVITTAIIILMFSLAAFFGTNFIGPPEQQTSSLLQQQ
jgi:hypothetical protein